MQLLQLVPFLLLKKRVNALPDDFWHSLHANLSVAFAKMPCQPQQPLATSCKMITVSVNNPLQLPQMMGIAKDMEGSITEVNFVVVMNQYPDKEQQDVH